MADGTNIPGGGEPPKIKLNPGKSGNGDTDKIKAGQPGPTPPKIQLRSAEVKKSTTRIDLADVIPPAAAPAGEIKELSAEKQAEFFKKSTIRIEQSAPSSPPSEAKRSTVRLDQTAQMGTGETARIDVKKTTLKIDQPAGATQPVASGETGRLDAKRSTIRIEDGAAGTQKVQGETARIDVKKSTIRIEAIPQTGSETQRTGTGGETRRIDLKTVETAQVVPPPSKAPAAPPASAGATAKITDTQQQLLKSETTRLEIPPEVAKRQTGRIQTAQIGGEAADVFKKRTGKVSTGPVAAPPIVPVTPAAPTVPASGASGSETVARPKTIVVRRPQKPAEAGGRPSAVTQVLAEQTAASARKSETARLEIPKEATAEERPTTRPKTIRIKRPDGTTARKQLTIARPEGGDETTLPEGLRMPEVAARAAEPGGFWAVLAIAATLVIGAVIYILLAQTYAPDLPFPGKFI